MSEETVTKNPFEGMTSTEVRAYLEKIEAKEKKVQQKKREEYEAKRDHVVVSLTENAIGLFKELALFKALVQEEMDEQALRLNEYGLMRGNSKGGFSVTNEADTYRIRRTRDTSPSWDERSTKGVALIKEFLDDAIKKRAFKEYTLIMDFLEKNQQGDLEYQKVMMLLRREDNYSDPRWKEGLRLLKESYKVVLKGFGYYFERKTPEGKWEPISLNFSSL